MSHPATPTGEAPARSVCPACASSAVVIGSIHASDDEGQISGAFFPEGLKFTALRRSVPVLNRRGFWACTACGCIWNQVPPDRLKQLLTHRRQGESVFAPGLPHKVKLAGLIALGCLVILASMGVVALLSL